LTQERLFGGKEEHRMHPKNSLNELTGKEWIQETASVWFQRGLGRDHPDTYYERQHPAPFPYLMVMRLLRFFTKKGDRVLDPFLGVASTLKACALSDRSGVGIELEDSWVKLAHERLSKEVPSAANQEIIQGDSREALKLLKNDYFDFLVTSPPYWQILNKPPDHRVKQERLKENLATRYSYHPSDLANISDYGEFLGELTKVWRECFRVLKLGRYAAIVIGDFRHKSKYVAYHADIMKNMEEVGFTPKGIIIFVQNAKKLYPYGYPYEYVPNIHHQYIMILKKEEKDAKTS
jgi:DNA modification methylase